MAVTFQIIGHKKSGKTTLTNDFLTVALQLKYQVSVVKHTHGPVDIPNNTDTGKFYERSNDVLLLNDTQTIHYQRNLNQTAAEQIREMQQTTSADFFIIEGLKELDYPKIALLKKDETPDDFGGVNNILYFVSIQKTTTNKEVISLLEPAIKKDFITMFLRELL